MTGGHGQLPITPLQQATLDLVKARPGVSYYELAEGLPRDARIRLNGMLTTLYIKRLVRKEMVGTVYRYWVK